MRLSTIVFLSFFVISIFTQCDRRDATQEKVHSEKWKTFTQLVPGDTFFPEDWNKEEIGFKLEIKEKTAEQFIYAVVNYPMDELSEAEYWYVYTDTDDKIIKIRKE